MNPPIPTYQLSSLTEPGESPAGVFFLGRESERPRVAIDVPYRSAYYKFGICLRGRAEVRVDLETYCVEPDCVVLLSPHVIKQWVYTSGDFEMISLFFTGEFIAPAGARHPDACSCFERSAQHVLALSATQAREVVDALRRMQQKYATPALYREEILRNLIGVLLYETALLYETHRTTRRATQTRGQRLAEEFRKLVGMHSATERGVAFYAEKLFVTPKHLTETVKEATGKRAGEWIAAAVVLEAKVLLHNPAVSIGEVADQLHFADQSAFGRFFRNSTGVSPTAYKQRR